MNHQLLPSTLGGRRPIQLLEDRAQLLFVALLDVPEGRDLVGLSLPTISGSGPRRRSRSPQHLMIVYKVRSAP